MLSRKKYPEIRPKKKRIKTAITRASLYFLGMGIQTAYKLDPMVKKEVDSWPDTFTFVFSALGGPHMLLQKRSGNLLYMGEKEYFFADLEICFKNIEYAFMAVTAQMTPAQANYHNRQFVKGDLRIALSVIRIINKVQAVLLPVITKNPNESAIKNAWLTGAVYLNAMTAGLIK